MVILSFVLGQQLDECPIDNIYAVRLISRILLLFSSVMLTTSSTLTIVKPKYEQFGKNPALFIIIVSSIAFFILSLVMLSEGHLAQCPNTGPRTILIVMLLTNIVILVSFGFYFYGAMKDKF
jgi:hypothetical protein